MRILKLVLIFLVLLTAGCTQFDSNEPSEFTQDESFPDQESWNAEMSFTKNGKRRAVLHAGYVAKYSKKEITVLKEGVKVDFYDDEGQLKSHLTSLEGKVFDKSKDMTATGDVIVVSRTGTHLYSEELFWNNEQERIVSKVPVMITTDEDTLYGDSFSSDPDLINYEITNTRGTSKKTISIEE